MMQTRKQINIDYDALVKAAEKKKMKLSKMSKICGRTSSYLSTMGKTGHISVDVYEALKERFQIDIGAKPQEIQEQLTLTFTPNEITLSPTTMREFAKIIAEEIEIAWRALC